MLNIPQDSEEPNSAQKFAKASWQIFIVAVILTMLSRQFPAALVIVELVVLLLLVIGLICGTTALFGIRKVGSERVLFPAVTGVILNGLLIFIFVTNFITARNQALMQTRTHGEQSSIVSNQAGNPSLIGTWSVQTPHGKMIWIFSASQMTTILPNGKQAPSVYEADYTQKPIWLNLHSPGSGGHVFPLILEFLSEDSIRVLGPDDNSQVRPVNFEGSTSNILVFYRAN